MNNAAKTTVKSRRVIMSVIKPKSKIKGCFGIGKIRLKKDLTGKRFGRLMVLGFSHKGEASHNFWSCECECGGSKIVRQSLLNNGTTRSCGCLLKEEYIRKRLDLTGKRFGRLKVIGLNRIQCYETVWACLCKCGKTCDVSGEHLNSGHTKSCGCFRLDTCKARKGILHPSWRKDLSNEDRILHKNRGYLPKYRKWRMNVFKRDRFICQISGAKQNIRAHHIYAWNKNKKLRYKLSNGITLNQNIHKLFHSLYGRGNNTLKQFLSFKKRYETGEFKNLLTAQKNALP